MPVKGMSAVDGVDVDNIPQAPPRKASSAASGRGDAVVRVEDDGADDLYDMGEDDATPVLPQKRGDADGASSRNENDVADLYDMGDAEADQEGSLNQAAQSSAEANMDFGFDLYDMGDGDRTADTSAVQLGRELNNVNTTTGFELYDNEQQQGSQDAGGELYDNSNNADGLHVAPTGEIEAIAAA